MAGLFCKVVTPQRELFAGEVAYAHVPGLEGSYGVLPGHVMFVTMHKTGVVSLWMDANGTEKRDFLVYDGGSQVFDDQLTVLARFGTPVEEIDETGLRAANEELKQQIQERSNAEDEQAKTELKVLQAQLQWNEFQLSHLATV